VGRRVDSIRPTDGTGWQNNGYGNVKVETWDAPLAKYRVHYTRDGEDAVPAADSEKNGVPDFVELFGATFDQVYEAEINQLGFREPLSDEIYHDRPDYGGDGRFDVYLLDQGSGADGYVVQESCTTGTPQRCAGYMVVENDFVGYGYSSAASGMKILASHEFFHVIQNAYRVGLDGAFAEGTAVWATEQVFPEQTDFEGFVKNFFKSPGRPIDDGPQSPSDLYPYGTAIWPAFLSERYGAALLPAILEELSEKGAASTSLDAIETVLSRDHQSSLAQAFAEFALWNYLTGDRAIPGRGYHAATSLPLVAVVDRPDKHPFRITGEMAYLSSAYYRVTIESGFKAIITSEYDATEVALHLVTGTGAEQVIVSAAPPQKSAEVVSRGDVTIVVASLARKDRHLPLSLAVRAEAPATADAGVVAPLTDAALGPDPVAGGGGGCAVTGAAADPDRFHGLGLGDDALWLAIAVLIVLGRGVRRATARRDCRRPAATGRGGYGVALALALLTLAGAGCSETAVNAPAPDLSGASDVGPADTTLVSDAGLNHDSAPDLPDPQNLAVGQFQEGTADAGGKISLTLENAETKSFIALLISTDYTPLEGHGYTTKLSNVPAKNPSRAPGAPMPIPPSCDFGSRLQQTLQWAKGKTLWQPKSYSTASMVPSLGDTRTFKIRDGAQTVVITGEAIAVDEVAVFWLDKTTTPLATIDAADLKQLADGFAKTIVPRERLYFGKESDIDGDGRIGVLLSPVVAKSAVAYVSPCDLIDPVLIPGCAASNQMELVYLSPPSSLQGPYNTPTALLETIAHEFQHAIYFYRKYILNNQVSGAGENPYVTEGLSHLAQDLSGYQAGNLYVVSATLDGIGQVSLPNLTGDSIKGYVPGTGDGIMRGASYLILRYLFDQAGGDSLDAAGVPVDQGGIAWLHSFIDQKEDGDAAFEKAAGMPLAQLTRQFWTAMALSNRGPGGSPLNTDPRYNFLPTTTDVITGRQRGCNLFAAFHASQMLGPALQPLEQADGTLMGGGAEFLTFKAAADQSTLTVEVQAPTAAKAMLRLIRIK
jgi:hypothetical protein